MHRKNPLFSLSPKGITGLPSHGRTLCALLAAGLVAAIGLLAGPTRTTMATPTSFTTLSVARQVPHAYTPSQIETAYNITSLLNQGIDGTGQTIALLEVDRFAVGDIQAFDAANGLPDPAIQQTYVGGKRFSLPNDGEAALDIEWAHALAPGAAIHVYYLRNGQPSIVGWRATAQAITSAVTDGAGTISLSWGACRATSGYAVASNAFAAAEANGVSIFVSSGDSGSHPGPVRQCGSKPGVAYPASDPSVVSVGGTSLTLAPDDSIARELAWPLSGGGRGAPLLRPAWQTTSNLNPGKYRFVPDVSFLADETHGAAIYYKGHWYSGGGTSLGAPSWAAIWALIRDNAQSAGVTVGAAPSLIYRIGNSSQYSSAFYDIVSGSNGKYHASPGWDPVTGWGTPNVAGLVAAVQSLSGSP